MGIRTAHGASHRCGQLFNVEVLPPDELPEGVPDPDPVAPAVPREANGRLLPGEAARTIGARGGSKKKSNAALARKLSLNSFNTDPAFKPYKYAAQRFKKYEVRRLAAVGGGYVGAGPSSIVASASLQLAASRYLFDKAMESGDPEMLKKASALANDSRQNLIAAQELAVRDARVRQLSAPAPNTLLAEALAAEPARLSKRETILVDASLADAIAQSEARADKNKQGGGG